MREIYIHVAARRITDSGHALLALFQKITIDVQMAYIVFSIYRVFVESGKSRKLFEKRYNMLLTQPQFK